MRKQLAIPKRGDLIWLDFSPQVGHEQAGRRPALVLSEQLFQKATGFVLVCPVTSHIRGNAFEVKMTKTMKTQGVALCQQVKTVDLEERYAGFIEKASPTVLTEVLEIVRVLVS